MCKETEREGKGASVSTHQALHPRAPQAVLTDAPLLGLSVRVKEDGPAWEQQGGAHDQ